MYKEEQMDLSGLNDKQQEAVRHTEGPLLILAGAGSGKTATMTSRIAYLIEEKGTYPGNILAVTFTNKAAGEMRERVEKLLGRKVNSWIMTFHALCLRILRRDGDHLDDHSSDFVVYDPADQRAVVKAIIKERNIDDKKNPPGALLATISDLKSAGVEPKDFLAEMQGDFSGEIRARVYMDYDRTLKKNNAMDFDDLILNTLKLFEKDPGILRSYQDRFRYIMVDEYQDTDGLQYKIISSLAKGRGNICVVGDDDQSIYGWRGADIRNILNFEKDFPGAMVVKLEQNYRSTGNILDGAYSVIKNNKDRKDKRLWTRHERGEAITYARCDDEKEEADYVAREIIRLCGPEEDFSDFAVLYRTNAQSRTFEEAFSRRDIPYRVVGGIRYYERKEIKDMIAYMRLVSNPRDDLSMERIINEPKRGVGPGTLSKLKALASAEGLSVFETVARPEILGGLNKKAGTALGQMTDAIRKYNSEKDNLRVSDIYDGLLRETGYLSALEMADTKEADIRIENLMEFKSVIYDYQEKPPEIDVYMEDGGETETERNRETGDLEEFLEKIALISDIDNHDPTENAVTLMTMHSAKGLEFPYVFMVGMEDGLFPSWRTMESPEGVEEERRLCYVGMTRAMKRLSMTSAEYRTMYGKGSYTRESQFMREMDPKLLRGDGVYVEKNEVRTGTSSLRDGYSGEPFSPFDSLREAKREVKKGSVGLKGLKAGDRVVHKKFGEGMVLEVDGNVGVVIFDRAGTKKLALDMAPLERVQETDI